MTRNAHLMPVMSTFGEEVGVKLLHSGKRKRTGPVVAPRLAHEAKRPKTESPGSLIPDPAITHSHQAGHTRADQWFDHTNNRPKRAEDIPFHDNDPPFFLQEQSADERSLVAHGSDASMQSGHAKVLASGPTESLLARMNASNGNDSDEFRSVIDDLTIENKKLRRRLKKYEHLHCSHLQEEKLFELRIHGLAAHKRRELEHTLKSFASSIEDDSPRKPAFNGAISSVPTMEPSLHKPSSASTFGSGPVDSAYASMSTGPQQSHARHGFRPQTARQNVRSYLHHIPSALISQRNLGLSDNYRRKTVVKRLEQLFTGKGAASHSKAHSHQQQQVSTAAAEADRSKIEAGGQRVWREGTREAHILPDNGDLRVENMEEITARARTLRATSEPATDLGSRATEASRTGTPEQRPTRPLDLDIHRAQKPSDNIDYIRHLGLAYPTDDNQAANGDEDGWTYLNLLINMAQLHTLNVTPEFIRKALREVSIKFELSADGNKVKWLGGTEGTSLTSDGDDNESYGNSKWLSRSLPTSKSGSNGDASNREESESALEPSSARLPSTATSFLPQEIGAKRRPVQTGASSTAGNFHYKPLFFHTARSDSEECSSISAESVSSVRSKEITTGFQFASNDVRDLRSKLRGRKHENGPIIFYNKAGFCTDLSGEPENLTQDEVAYARCTDQPLGQPPPKSDPSKSVGIAETTRTGDIEIDSNESIPDRTALDLEDLMTSLSDCTSHDSPMSMEVSGLGGIHPEDNFVVKVQTRHEYPHNSPSKRSPGRPMRRILHSLPRPAINAFKNSKASPRSTPPINSEVISAVKTTMAPSTLPPPSYACLPSTSSDSDGSSDDDVPSSVSVGIAATPPRPTIPTHRHRTQSSNFRPPGLDLHSSNSTESKETSYGGSPSEDSDESIDLLAHARVQDPEAVRLRENEFEVNRGSEHQSGHRGSESMTVQSEKSDGRRSSGTDSMKMDGESSEEG